MEGFFAPKRGKFRGRPITAPPTVINKDLYHIPAGELKPKDLNHLMSIAEDRTKWKRGSRRVHVGEKGDIDMDI